MDIFKDFFESSRPPFLIYNLKTLFITESNKALERFYGYSSKELQGLKIGDLLGSSDFKEGSFELEQTLKDGQKKFINATVSYIGREKEFASVVFRDVTKEVERIKELLVENQRYGYAIDGSYDGLWDWNLLTNEAYHSDVFETALGYNPGELKNTYEAWRDNLHPDDKDAALSRARDYIEGRSKVYNSEFRLRKKDGEYIWLRGRGKLIKDSSGNPIRFVGSNQDITKEVELRNRLEKQNQLLEKTFNNASVMIYVKNTQGSYLLVNKYFKKFFGLKDSDIKNGISTYDLVSHKDFKAISDVEDRVLHSKKAEVQKRVKIKSKTGQIHYFNIKKVLLNPDDPIDKRELLGIGVDVTEYMEMESRLSELNDLLRQEVASEKSSKNSALTIIKERDALLLQQSKMALIGEMVSMIAHQWKQPLSVISLVIQNISDYLEFNADKSLLKETETETLKQIEYMSETINSFRNFFKPSKQKQPFYLYKNIDETVDIMKHAIVSKGIDVDIECNKEVIVYGYPNEFKQVLMTLFANAKDALVDNKRDMSYIKVKVESEEDLVKIYVEDSAGGVDPALLPTKLFDAYITTKGEKGTGIGLLIAKKIVEGMGGSIEAYNKNLGACFLIKLHPYTEGIQLKGSKCKKKK